MRPCAHQFMPVFLHSAEERTSNVHVPLAFVEIRPFSLLVAIGLWYHPAAEGYNPIVFLRVFNYKSSIRGIIETNSPRLIHPLAVSSVVWDWRRSVDVLACIYDHRRDLSIIIRTEILPKGRIEAWKIDSVRSLLNLSGKRC